MVTRVICMVRMDAMTLWRVAREFRVVAMTLWMVARLFTMVKVCQNSLQGLVACL